jgi:hypothetical protein
VRGKNLPNTTFSTTSERKSPRMKANPAFYKLLKSEYSMKKRMSRKINKKTKII